MVGSIASVQGGQLVTNVGNIPLNQDIFNILVNKDIARSKLIDARSRYNSGQIGLDELHKYDYADQYFSALMNAAEASDEGWRTAYTQQAQDLLPKLDQGIYSSITSAPRPSGENARGKAFSTYSAMGGDAGQLADQIGLKAQQDAKKNRPFYRKAVGTVVPLAMGTIATVGFGAALGAALGVGQAGATAAGGAASAGTAGTAATISSTALLSAPVSSATGFSASKIATGLTIGKITSGIGTVARIARGVSAVSGLLGPSGRAEKITVQGNSGPGSSVAQTSEVATTSSAEVEEEARRKRAIAANATNRRSTIRAGALASRPVLGSAGLLG